MGSVGYVDYLIVDKGYGVEYTRNKKMISIIPLRLNSKRLN